ncbi:MAG: SecD/SecF fusion protein [Verrucomicrobiales bacterium]|jgi:SecD/SecF fusion protein
MKNQVLSQVPGPAGNPTPPTPPTAPVAPTDPSDPAFTTPKPEETVDGTVAVPPKAPEVYNGPGPISMFSIGLGLFALFIAYFAIENPLKKRIVGTALAAGVTALSLFFFLSLGVDKAIDLAGGSQFVVKIQPRGEQGVTKEDRSQVRRIFQARLDPDGKRGLTMTSVGSDSLEIQMPGISEAERAEVERTILETAKLEIILIHEEATRNKYGLLARYEQEGYVPIGARYVDGYGDDVEEVSERRDFVELGLPMSGNIVTGAWASPNGPLNWQINVELTSDGGKQMLALTMVNEGRRMAMLLDDKCISAPNISSSFGKNFRITGDFTRDEAQLLANLLRNPLENSVTIEKKKSISPEMGDESIRRGMVAGISGLALVLIFVLIYYNFAGLVATVGLTLNIVVIFGVLAILNTAVSMAGIAGIVLTIGIAIDANVLIYERLREEQASGKNIRTALDTAYSKAFSAIFDANVTTLIAAVVLFMVAAGAVKGFSVTLMIGVFGTLFAALLVTRVCFNWLTAGSGIIKKLPLGTNPLVALIVTLLIGAAGYGGWLAGGGGLQGIWAAVLVIVLCVGAFFFIESKVLKNKLTVDLSKAGFDFISKRRIAAYVSTGLIIAAAVVLGSKRSDALAVDLREGDQLEIVATSEELSKEQILASLKKLDLKSEPSVQEQTDMGTGKNSFVIRLDTKRGDDAFRQIQEDAGREFVEHDLESTSAKVGAETLVSSAWALGLALVGIMIYVSMRFESFAFALGAIVALIHDLVIVTGLIVLCGREISLIMVGALLTIAGYSINDTIVVFDRVREGLKTKRGDVGAVMNFCLNATLGRTVLTSLTTLIVVVTLFIFGGPSLNDFALTLIFGVLVGTYSSIFVASPIVLWWARKYKLNLRREVLDREQAKLTGGGNAPA